MTVGETFTWLRRAGPLARIERQTWQRIAVVCLFGAAILFPIGHRNDADIDAAAPKAITLRGRAFGPTIAASSPGSSISVTPHSSRSAPIPTARWPPGR